MTRINHLPASLQNSFSSRSLLKVITGLNNFDKSSVACVAKAAGIGGADLLDVACHPEIIDLAIQHSSLPICVSAIDPELFPPAVEAGALIIEIGNFDSFYLKGRFFSSDEILALTNQTRKLLPDIPLSVTVPHTLPLDKQSQLALDLADIGADIIQTEGGTSAKPHSAGTLGLIEKAAPTLAAAHVLSETIDKSNFNIPILCASGLSTVTIPMAFATGASGVGVGSAVNKLKTEIEMIAAIKSLREATNSSRSLVK
ncbi:DUF561 domain-containing protein [Prochlorococcus sp. MIT 1223]|uniref:DUF561 domain-containing protein n=1 Tax=Prochlorococcus sp. MIT 1223 TaxID=3096217 RepID=UPI002A747946|nr:DUF561 domain-containing protein [Prochlorococcus sp. MIT 1223]